MNLERLVNQKKQYELDNISPYIQDQIQKKKKLSVDSISSVNNNSTLSSLPNNIENISTSQLSYTPAKPSTSPSSQAFSALINKIDLPQQSAKQIQPQVQQQHRPTTQQKLKGLVKQHQMKMNNNDISEISEYQQSLMLFNMLQNMSSSNQQESQESQLKSLNNHSIQENFRQNDNKNKDKVYQQLSNAVSPTNQQSHNTEEDQEAELLRQLVLNLSKKQRNQFPEQYISQQESNFSQKQNHFKIPSAPNCFNSKNEQSLNFTSTEEDEDDENYYINQFHQKFIQVLAQQLPSQNGCSTVKNTHC